MKRFDVAIVGAGPADLAFRRGDISARQLSGYDSACRRALGRRETINGLVRAVVHRPYFVRLLLDLSPRNNFPVSTLVNLVCRTAP